MKPAPGTPPTRADLLFAAILLGICLVTALTQAVNCFPDDGWFQTQHRIIGHWPGADNYTPIAAPAYFHAATHALAALLTLRRQGKDHHIPVLQVPRQRQDLQHKAC